MPSTYLSLHYHVVFSTRLREPVIDGSWRTRLLEYLGGTVNGLAGQEEHHRVRTFREELVELLDLAGVEYEPKFLD